MKYAELGNTGIQVSRICIGAMSFGKASEQFHQWTLDQDETREMIAHAWELGRRPSDPHRMGIRQQAQRYRQDTQK